MTNKKIILILASNSPRRRELIKELRSDFEVTHVDIDESVLPGEDPTTHARRLALDKALSAKKNVSGDKIIITADTIVTLDNKIFGKPSSKDGAKKMLQTLRDKTHTVITAFCVLDTSSGEEIVKDVKTLVTFREITDAEIDEYIETGEPLDKAGSYGVQGIGKKFIDKIEGSYTNVVGLPVDEVKDALEEFGIACR